jgi:branched-chain amino acid aminotransferase
MHLDRLYGGLGTVRLEPGLTRAEIVRALYATVQANKMRGGVHARIMVTRGAKKTPSQDPRLTVGAANVVIIAEHKKANPSAKKTGVALHTASVRRPPPDSLDQRINCHSKIHEVIALNEALEAGADEALMLDIYGNVATCNATNFFAVVDGEVWTSTGSHCLPGITRANVIKLAEHAGLTMRQFDFTPAKLEAATEAFVTGTFGGLTPVSRIDGLELDVFGPVTRQLSSAYEMAKMNYIASARH